MEAYDWMVKYTPQTEWIQRRGIMLWLAFFFIELGAGIFFISSIFDSLPSLLAGWLVCGILGCGLHLLYLGKPSRVWRMLISSGWKTSWISRGLVFVSLFLVLGLIHIALTAWSSSSTILLIAADILAFLTVIYGGFAMNYVNGIPLWNTALLPILFVVSGLWGGTEVASGLAVMTGQNDVGAITEEWIRLFLIGFIVLVPVYLISVRYTSTAGRDSVKQIVLGKSAPLFWVGVVILGMAVPITAVITSFILGLQDTPMGLIYTAIICGLVGDLAMRYLILRCGVYSPLLPS